MVHRRASVWTYAGAELEEDETIAETYEGRFGFAHWGPQYGQYQGEFTCNATIEVEAEGPSAGRITMFTRDESSCDGAGHWAGCFADGLSSNVSAGWNVDIAPSAHTVTASSGSIEIVDNYGFRNNEEPSPRTMKFKTLYLVPILDEEGRVAEFTLEGRETNGLIHEAFGPFTPTGSGALGIK